MAETGESEKRLGDGALEDERIKVYTLVEEARARQSQDRGLNVYYHNVFRQPNILLFTLIPPLVTVVRER